MTASIDVCSRLVDRLQVPLHAQVWDDAEYLAMQRGLDAFTRRRTMRRFAKLLARAERTAVIGESMAAHYARQYGARCAIIRHGISDSVITRNQPTSADEFVIGFSGGMYCPSAWKALQAALGLLGWQVGTKAVRLIVMGADVKLCSSVPAAVDFLGWRSDDEVRRRLADCDLLYLPQPFEEWQRLAAELAFPTKASTYTSTGRPVLVHAPQYASLPVFARTHPIGAVCSSLDPAVLAEEIRAIATDERRYSEAAKRSAHIANTELSRANFEAQVRSFLGESRP